MFGKAFGDRRGLYRAGASLAALSVALAAPSAVFAQEQTARFSIAAQPLSSGLLELARQARISIVAPPGLVANKAGKGVAGSLTLRAALKAMLDGTGLQAQFVSPNAVRIVEGGAGAAVSGGQAQDAAAGDGEVQQLAELIVTGTHIKGQEPIGSRLVALGRQDIIDSGRANMTELLKVIPQIQTIGTVEGARSGRGQGGIDNNGAGSSVNLRGLGSESTLVLVNGRRIAPSAGGAFVDISQIPVSAVESVEVLPDGASALYGSDAVGGVVNFVLRKRFDGADTTLHYGLGDGFHEYEVGQTVGKTWSSGSVLLSYEYYSRSHLASSKRAYAVTDLRAFGGDNFIPISGAGQFAGNPGTIMVGNTPYAAIPGNQNGQGLTLSSLLVGQSNQVDPQFAADLQPSQTRNSVVASLKQDLTPHVRVFADALYSVRDFVTQNRADAASVVVGPSNPYFIAGIPGSGGVDTVRYSFLRDFDNRTEGRSTNYTVTGGFDFDLPYKWSGEVYGSTGRDNLVNRGLGLVNTARLALAAGTPGAAGVRPAGLPYFNPFGAGSFTDPQTLNYIQGSTWNHQRYNLDSVSLSATGPLFQLPAGEVRVAVGFDDREERYKSERTEDISTLTPVDITALSTAGFGIGSFKRRITAGYGELSIPVFGSANAVPFIQKFDISAAVRGEHYSDFGSTVNPKVGFRWQPVEGLTFRGSWGTSFRAPRLVELDDTANAYYIRPFPNAGAVAGDPSTFAPAPTNSWVIYLADAGNGELKPETAETYTIGADFKPDFLPGFKASVSYYHIRYSNRILTPSTPELLGALAGSGTPGIVLGLHPSQAVLDAIYANNASSVGLPGGLFKDSGYPGFFLPGFPNNQLPAANIYAIVHVGLSNYGTVLTDGWDFSASYRIASHLGDFNLGAAVSLVTTYKIERGNGGLLDYLDTMSNPISLRGRFSAGWTRGSFSAQVAVNHTGGYLNPYKNQQVSSWNTVDLHLGYRLASSHRALDGLLVTVDIENLFDADPPFVNNQDIAIGYDPEMASPRGRVTGLTLRKAW
jgi:outer membrane receptor protein involved in Fe transport